MIPSAWPGLLGLLNCTQPARSALRVHISSCAFDVQKLQQLQCSLTELRVDNHRQRHVASAASAVTSTIANPQRGEPLPISHQHPGPVRELHPKDTQQQAALEGTTSPINEAPSFSGRTGEGRSSALHSAETLRVGLLDAGLRYVPTYGWSAAALVAAAHELSLSPAVTGLLPRREAQLVEHFIRHCNEQLRQQLRDREKELRSLPLEHRLHVALRARLEMLSEHISSWPQAIAIVSHPSELRHSLPLLATMIDDVWHAAGDNATDTSWYAKRAALSAVYTSTELFMITDYSPHFADTWHALDRRIADALTIGHSAHRILRGATGRSGGGAPTVPEQNRVGAMAGRAEHRDQRRQDAAVIAEAKAQQLDEQAELVAAAISPPVPPPSSLGPPAATRGTFLGKFW